MLIVPIIISICLWTTAKKNEWEDNYLTIGITVCWMTFVALFACDMLGEWFGWWINLELV